jgi:hypothetical protein
MNIQVLKGEGAYPRRDARRRGRAVVRRAGLAALAASLALVLTGGGGAEGEEDDTRLAVAGIRSLVVEGSFFNVKITGRAGPELEARFEIPERLRKRGVQVLHETRGSTLRVYVKRPPGLISTAGLTTPALIFEVPVSTAVQVENSSGSVSVAGLDTEKVLIESSSGRCEVADVRAGLEITSSSGSQDIQNADGDKVLRASSGKISVRDAGGDIRAGTSSGSQTYAGIAGSIDAEASSGSISVTDQQGSLELRASSGSLRGATVTVTGASSFTTSSGSIDFDFTNDFGDFSFDLRSSSGTIRVGGTRAKGRVVMGTGPIRLQGTSSSGSQSYR